MHIRKTRKKENNEDSSQVDDSINISINSGLNVDNHRRGRDTNGRTGNQKEDLDKSTTESGYKEVLYLDPHDNLRRQYHEMSPVTQGRQTLGVHYMVSNRSPKQPAMRQSVISSVRHDLNERHDTAQLVGRKPIPTLTVALPLRKEDPENFERERERSPVMKLAGGLEENEFNPRNLQNRRSPRETHNLNLQYGLSSITGQDSNGNLLLDQPVNVLGSFIGGADPMHPGTHTHKTRHTVMLNNRDDRERDREIQFIRNNRSLNNSREINEDINNQFDELDHYEQKSLKQKMSPNRNNLDELDYYREKTIENEEERKNRMNEIRRISKHMKLRDTAKYRIDSHGKKQLVDSEGDQYDIIHEHYIDDIESLMKMKTMNKENLSMNDDLIVKIMKRKNTRAFKPKQNQEGKLISAETHIYAEVNNDQMFPDRRTVLMKMNKLSHIMLAKSNLLNPNYKSFDRDEPQFGRQTAGRVTDDITPRANSSDVRRKTLCLTRSPQDKFIRVTMAMLTSRGPNCEDRIITRVMRFDKGGVVDLAHSNQKVKKYEVKKIRRKGEKQVVPVKRTIKEKEKAVKVMQGWWREILNKYKNLLSKIVIIQKHWRGRWLRSYLYEIIYSTILVENFIDILKSPILSHVRATAMEKLLPFAQRFRARKNLVSIMKIQSHAKKFLKKMRDRNSKMGLLLGKLLERKKVLSLNAIKKFAGSNNIKKEKHLSKINNLLLKTKKVMRVRIFHTLLFKIFKRPIIEIKTLLFRNMLKSNFKKRNSNLIRAWFLKWLKNSLRSANIPEVKIAATQLFAKALTGPKFIDFTQRMRKLPPRGLKIRLLKRFIKNNHDNSEVSLKLWLWKWKENSRGMVVKDFKDDIKGRFLLKTTRLSEKRNIQKKFRLWRDANLKSKDVTRVMSGVEHLRSYVRRRVKEQIMPIDTVSGIKSRILKRLMREKFTLIPLRHYWNKWKKAQVRGKSLETTAKFVLSVGNKINLKTNKNILLRRFLNWKRTVNILFYINSLSNKDHEKRKFFAITKLMSGTHKLAKRQAFKTAYPEIIKYLNRIILQQATKKLLLLNPKLSRILLRNYFGKWKENMILLRQKETRGKFFEILMKKSGSKIQLNVIKRCFGKWRRNLPKNLEIKYYTGSEKLQTALYRRNKDKIKFAFKNKVNLENAKDGIVKAFGLKEKYIKRNWRLYLLKWKKVCDKLNLKNMKNDLCGKLFNTLLGKFRNRILSNRFSHWRKVPKINMKDIFDRFKQMIKITNLIVQKNIKPSKRTFLSKLKTHNGEKSYLKAANILSNMAINGRSMILKEAMIRWKDQVKNHEIHDLKIKLLRYSVGQEGIKNRKKSLSKGFFKWLRNVKLDNLQKHSDNNITIYKATNVLNAIKNRRYNDFLIRLKRLMNLDSRGKMIFNIQKRLNKPRISLSRLFDRWRRVNEVTTNNSMKNDLKKTVFKNSCKKIGDRVDRDTLNKCFNKWKGFLRKPQEYYVNVAKAVKKTDGVLKMRAKPAFNQLAQFKNYTKLLTNILPASLRFKKRKNKEALLRCWNKWKKNVSVQRTRDFNGLIVNKLCKNLSLTRKTNDLAWAFHRWGNFKWKSFYFPDFVKGLEVVGNVMKRPWRRDIYNRLNKVSQNKEKSNALTELFNKSQTFGKHKLRNCLLKWWKINLLDEEGVKSRIMRNIKRYVVNNHILKPTENYFRRWLRNMYQKQKNYVPFLDAVEKLKTGIRKKHLPNVFKLLKNYRSAKALSNALFYKALPANKNVMKRFMKEALLKWWKNTENLKMKDMRLKMVNTLHGKNKIANEARNLKKHFEIWREKEPEIIPINLQLIIDGEKKVYQTLAKKYLSKFIPELKEFSTKKFHKGLVLKSSKFHMRHLDIFFARWRETADILKNKQIKGDLVGKLLARTKKYQNKDSIKNHLKKKFDLWKNNLKDYDNRINKIIPEANSLIRKHSLKNKFHEVMEPLRAKRLTSHQNEKLKRSHEIGVKVLTNHLRNALMLWRDQVPKLQIQELRGKTMEAHLKHFSKRMDKNRLFRSFQFWKGLMLGRSTLGAVLIGVNTLKKLFTRKPFYKLIDKTKLMNRKIPFGMGLSEALINLNPNVVKSIAIRNIALRPFYKKWKANVDKMKTRDLQLDIFKKIFYPSMRNQGRLVLRRALNLWKDKIDEEDKLNLQKKFHATILKNIHDKNLKLWMRLMLRKWKLGTDDHHNKLSKISLGVIKLRHTFARNGLHKLLSKLKQNKDGQSKFAMVKKIMTNSFRNNDRGNVFYCFTRWRKLKNNHREQVLKHTILKNLLNKHESKEDEDSTNSLHEKLLRWRIKCAPKDYFKSINNIRNGKKNLDKIIRKKLDRNVFDKIKNTARLHKIKEMMCRMMIGNEKSAQEFILRNKFKLWRIRVGDTNILKNRFKSLVSKYHKNSEVAHNELIKKPTDDLIECMRKWVALRIEKANVIKVYCKSLLNTVRRMKLIQRNRIIHKAFSDLNSKMAVKKRLLFTRWKKNADMVNADDSSKVIQKFLRGKQNDLKRKRQDITDGAEHLKQFAKMKVFNDLYHNGRVNRKRQLMLRLIKDTPDEVKLEFLKKSLLRWWGVILKEREHSASKLITTVMKGHIARKLKDLLLKQKALLNNAVGKLFFKHVDKRKLYFNKWALDTKMNKCNESAQVIHTFLRGRLHSLKETRANDNLRVLFRKSYINKLHRAIDQAAKTNKDRGMIMYETLKNIFIQAPFDKVKQASKWIGRLKKLHSVYPKITEALRNHWLPIYMRKWKSRTYDDKIRKIIQVQSWTRGRFGLWKARAQVRKIHLAQKYLSKLSNDNDLLLKLAIKSWAKKSKLTELHKQASVMQAVWRGNTSRKNVDRILNQKKVHTLLRKAMVKRICDEITKCSDYTQPLRRNLAKMGRGIERRYTTNNLIDLANNTIRNACMFDLTKKREFVSQKTLLREYFERFKRFGDNVNKSAVKMQTKFRQFRAKNQLSHLMRIKDSLLKLKGKYDTTDEGKKKIAFNRWNNIANLMKLNDKAKVIQDYLREKNARLINTRFINFFIENAKQLAKTKLLDVAKTYTLKKKLQSFALKTFLPRLVNKTKKDKYRDLFTKRYNQMDDQIRNLYLKKYVDLWNHTTKRINNKRLASALTIGSLRRGHLAREVSRDLLEKKRRTLMLISRLVNDNDLKKQIHLRLWFNKTRESKLEDSAKVIQKFMVDIKDTNEKLRTQRRLVTIRDGLFDIRKTWLKAAPRNAIEKIKSEANRKLVEKVSEDIENKKKDHLETSLKNIKNYGNMKNLYKNQCAKKIQVAFNLFKHRSKIMDVIGKIVKMRSILRLMMDRNLRLKNKGLKIWRRNALGDSMDCSAKIIQKFLSNKVLRWRGEQEIKSKENLYKLLRNHFVNCQLRPYMKDFVTAWKLDKMFWLIKIHMFKKLKSNIFKYEKSTILSKLMKLTPKLAFKLKKNKLTQYRSQVDKLRRKRGAELIQRNFRLFKANNRTQSISEKIQNIFLKLDGQHSDIRKYYLALWKRNAHILKTKNHAGIICDFVDLHWKRIKAKKCWWNLTNGLFIKHNVSAGFTFARKYKQRRASEKMFKLLDLKVKRNRFDQLKTQGLAQKKAELVKSTFNKFELRRNKLSLWQYNQRWRAQNTKLNERDAELVRMVRCITLRKTIIAAQRVNAASLVKKVFFFTDKIRAKEALKNIKWRASNKEKLRLFGKNLLRADVDLRNKNSDLFASKLYRLYMFKILDVVYKRLEFFQQKVVKPRFGSKLLNRLRMNMVEVTKHAYDHEKSCFRSPINKVMQFNAAVRNPKREQLELMQKNPIKYLTPLFFNFMEELIKRRFRFGLEKLKYHQKAHKFCEKMKAHVEDKLIEPKKEFMKSSKDKYAYICKTPALLLRLKTLLRANYIKSFRGVMKSTSRIYKIMNLLKITISCKKDHDESNLKSILKRWLWVVEMNKIARLKMKAMYESMHSNYLNMAKEIFGNEDSYSGLVKEIDYLNIRMGTFENIKDDQYNFDTLKTLPSRYTHNHNFDCKMEREEKIEERPYEERHYKENHYEDKEERHYEERQYEENHYGEMHYGEMHYENNSLLHKDNPSVIGDNPEYYYDEGIGDATEGRYKVDTNKSEDNYEKKKKK